MANVTVTDDVAAGLYPMKAALGFYIGGMGAKGQNYHTKLMARMGFEEEALKIQELFFEGKRDEAIAMVPRRVRRRDQPVGPPERIRDRLEAWKESPVTTILMYPSTVEHLRQVARSSSRRERRLVLEGTAFGVGAELLGAGEDHDSLDETPDRAHPAGEDRDDDLGDPMLV